MLSDINNEPDDQESPMRFQVYSNEYTWKDLLPLLRHTFATKQEKIKLRPVCAMLERKIQSRYSCKKISFNGLPVKQGSTDPDGNALSYKWYFDREVTGLTEIPEMQGILTEDCSFVMPLLKPNQQMHLILEVTDSGNLSR